MKREKKMRVCVTLPRLMAEDYRERARLAGISVSRAIYLTLKHRSGFAIISRSVEEAIRDLQSTIRAAINGGKIDPQTLLMLRQNAEFYSAFLQKGGDGIERQ